MFGARRQQVSAALSQVPRSVLLGLIALGLAQSARGQNWAALRADDTMIPGALYVRFVEGRAPAGALRSGFASFDNLSSPLQVSGLEAAFPILSANPAKQSSSEAGRWLQGVYRLTYNAPIAPDAAARFLARSPDVDMVEPMYIYQRAELPVPMVDPNDTQYASDQLYLPRLNLDDAWDVTKGDSGSVVIAIVDSGADITHPDLAANIWTNPGETDDNDEDDDSNGYADDMHGWRFHDDSPDVSPRSGDSHGTRVAGAANAVTNNSKGIAGVAWNAETMIINATCPPPSSAFCYAPEGILYAAYSGADVINCSWASNSSSFVVEGLIELALDEGALVVASAGNGGDNLDNTEIYPAKYKGVLSVGATHDDSDWRPNFSTYGRTVNTFAPGVDIAVTTLDDKYTESDGTSFSAPLVSGIVALVMTERDGLKADQVRELIRLTSESIDASNGSGFRGLLGGGRPNADEALSATLQPALRLTSYTISGEDNDDAYEPSETVTISATFTNHGGDASNLTVGFEESDSYVDWSTSSVTVGALKYGASHTGSFTFDVASNTPRNHQTTLYTSIAEGTFTDGTDVVPLILNTLDPFVTQSTSSIKISIVNDGRLGHPGYKNSLISSAGFERNSVDYLHEAGLMLGTASNSIADVVTGGTPNRQEADFVIKSGTRLIHSDPGTVGSEDVALTLAESSSSTANFDVEVDLKSHTFDASADDDYVILHYTITNTGNSSISGLRAGLFLDFEVNSTYGSDDAGFDSQRRAGYVESSSGSGVAVGARLLSFDGALGYAAVSMENTVLNGFTDAEKWSLLSGGVGTTSQSSQDVGQVISAGPFSISAGSSAEVAFALVSGGSSSEFLTNSDAAQRKWHTIDGGGLRLTSNVSSISEGAGATTVTITAATRDGSKMPQAETVSITATGSGTASAVDFGSIASFSISIAKGASSGTGTFTLTPTNDSVDETDETITISSANAHVVQGTTITLTDDDAAPTGISLTASADTVDEDDGSTSITLTGTVSGTTTFGTGQTYPIRVTGSGGRDVVGFAAVNSFNLTIPAASTTGTATFNLVPTNDACAEVDETVTISSTSSAVSNSPTIVLADDDGGESAILSLSTDVTTLGEGDGATKVTVDIARTDGCLMPRAGSVSVTVAGSGVASAVDFTPVSPLSILVSPAGADAKGSFTLTPTDDAVDETNETITLSSTHAMLTGTATISLTDNDAAPTGITLVVSEDTVDEGDGATTITLTGTVGGTTTYGAAQTLPISVDGSGGSDVVDFTDVADFDLTIPGAASSGSTTFTLTPTDDSEEETDETITLSSTSSLVSNSPTVVITDNDGGGAIDIQLTSSVSTLSESASATTVTVTASTKSGNNVASDQSLTIAVSGSGTASAVDFAAVSDFTITISSGSSSGTGTFTLTPTNDVVDETDETITISSSSSLVSQNATITLTDDDATPAGINLVVSEDTVDEGDGSTTITLTGTVSGSTTYGTAQTLSMSAAGAGTASAVDFAAISDFNVVIAAAATKGTATFTVTPTNDKVDETDETITLSSSSKAALTSPTVVITDDDATPSGVTLSLSPTSVAENAGATTVTVTGTVGGTTTYGAKQTLSISVDGSGTAEAVDFAAVSDFNLEIAAEGTKGTATFTLTPTDDKVDEANETITVSSSNSIASNKPIITLTDNDAAPTGITLVVSEDTVDEGDGATTITLTGTVGGTTTYGAAQTLPISAAGSGTASAVDYTAISDFDLAIAAEGTKGTATFTVTPTDDQTSETDETITLSSTSSLVSNSPTVVITDNDGGGAIDIKLTSSVSTLSESASATTVTITAATKSGNNVASDQALTISVAGSGTASAVDFAAVSDFTVTISSGSSSGTGTFTLTPTNDVVDETDETITISSSSALVSQNATITLTDDDATPAGINLVVSEDTVDEGDGSTTITLTGTVSGSTTYGTAQTLSMVAAGSGTASAVDFAAISDFSLVIAAAATKGTATFTVTPTTTRWTRRMRPSRSAAPARPH